MLTEKMPSKKREGSQSIALWDVFKNSGILDMVVVVGSSPIVITIYSLLSLLVYFGLFYRLAFF
jgi:hypothetical protein